MKNIKWNVKAVAGKRGIETQAALAEKCGIDTSTAGRIWRGSAVRVDLNTLGKICTGLGCGPGSLLRAVNV
tara:strand:+ start:300 stop:512 length:213 start_codon:yes stop_codon:yes gene_type:complete